MSIDAGALLKTAAARFDALSLRERALVALSIIAVVWLAWDWSIGQSQRRDLDNGNGKLASLQSQIGAETKVQHALRAAQKNEPNAALHAERDSLDAEVAALDARLEATVGRFVPPTQVPKMIESVVARHSGVSLIRVKSLPAEAVRVNEDSPPVLFRHPLQVELEGGYFDVMSYLKDLESSSWQFAWRSLDYSVTEHPRARVVFEIETLSPDRNWLGV